MNNKSLSWLVLCLIFTFSSCKNKPQTDVIIANKPIVVKTNIVQKIGDYTQNRKIKWAGADYNITITVAADQSLPTISSGSQKYYDNRITVQVQRADGSVLFNRAFTKSDFASYIDADFKEKGALLGIAYAKSEGDNLVFAASVGSPDKTSDEFIPMTLKVSKSGTVSISKDSQIDTGSDNASDDNSSPEDGV